MAEEILDYSLFLLLIASTINRSLKKLNILPDVETVELEVDATLRELNNLTKTYLECFRITNCKKSVLQREDFVKILQERKFNEFVAISEKNLVIDTVQYTNKLSTLVLAATADYQRVLVKNVNDLSKLWQNDLVLKKEFEARRALASKDNKIELGADDIADSNESIDSGADGIEENDSENSALEPQIGIQEDTVPDNEGAAEAVPMEDIEPEETDPDAAAEQSTLDGADAEVDENVVEDASEKLKDEASAKEADETKLDVITQVDPVKKDEKTEDKSEQEEDADDEQNEEETEKVEEELKKDIEEDEDDEDDEDDDDDKSSRPRTRNASIALEEPRTRKRSISPSTGAQHKRFQHIATNLINSIKAHRYSSPFLQPVNSKDAPEYSKVIHEPKDLKNILKSIKLKRNNPEYELLEQLERDIMLMFANCIMFNKSDSDLVELTKSMKNDVNNIFKLFKEAETGH